jgi:hypothetical protein
MALLSASISATGPAMREVPVSAMAWQPPLQNCWLEPRDMLNTEHNFKVDQSHEKYYHCLTLSLLDICIG